MKKRITWILIMILICNVGCRPKNINLIESTETKQSIKQIGRKEKKGAFTEAEWLDFFKAYFSFTEEELLILNQKRATIDEIYWEQLRQYYGPLIQLRLGNFLAEDVVTKLESQYLFDALTLPQWVFINQYMVQGQAEVEKVERISTRDLGNDVVYEVAVTTTNGCYPVNEFIKHYTWGEAEGYFVNKIPGEEELVMALYETNLEEMDESNYLYSEKEDKMKIKQHFWVTISKDNPFKIRSIHHAQPWKISRNDYKMVLDSKYITRIPYKEEASQEEKDLINQFFQTLMTSDKDFYTYYEKAYDTSARTFERMWEDQGLSNQMDIQEVYYRETFPISILPYKDEIVQLTISSQGIRLKPSVYSTKEQPRYVVTIPTEALLNTNQKVYYNYKYFIGIENKKIEFVQLMSINEIEAEDYIGI